MAKILLINATELVTCTGHKARRGETMKDIGLIPNGYVLMEDGIIKEVGQTSDILKRYNNEIPSDILVIDCSGKTVLPGFVDSHTHFVFGGYRAQEFGMRLMGVPYMEIMKAGGGIAATTEPTRRATIEELEIEGFKRLDSMLLNGITTVEGKSGYGLDVDTELKQLKVMKSLEEKHPVEIARTYMGAHAMPKEMMDNPRKYLDLMIKEVMPIVAKEKLAQFCDVFCEKGVFELDETREILEEARKLGFDLKLHADEIVTLGGAELAAELNAVSADHLLKVSDEGIKKLANSETVATLLPLTAFSLKEDFAPARKLIDEGCAVALATDLNPGSCFSQSVPLLFALATIYMGMTVEEAIISMTLNGAAAIKRADKIGSIDIGKQADIIILDCPSHNFLSYHFAMNLVEKVIKKGKVVMDRTLSLK